jgi:hypothetical protein
LRIFFYFFFPKDLNGEKFFLSDFAGPPADFIGKNIFEKYFTTRILPEYSRFYRALDAALLFGKKYLLFILPLQISLSLHQTCIYGESQAGGEITSVALKRTVGRPRNG